MAEKGRRSSKVIYILYLYYHSDSPCAESTILDQYHRFQDGDLSSERIVSC